MAKCATLLKEIVYCNPHMRCGEVFLYFICYYVLYLLTREFKINGGWHMVKLERCPFCGNLAAYSRIVGEGFSVVCRNRGCMAIAIHKTATERDDMALMWNRRGKDRFVSRGAAKACPFCGGRALVSPLSDGGVSFYCLSCGMMVSFAQSHSVTQSTLAWNRRDTLPSL